MTKQAKIIVHSAIFSVAILLVLILVNFQCPRLLALDIKWLIVAATPIIVGLLLAGIIRKFSAFGIELEMFLSEELSPTLIQRVNILKAAKGHRTIKGTLLDLEQMPQAERGRYSILSLQIGLKDYYSANAIYAYYEQMVNVRFFELSDASGEFVALIPCSHLLSQRVLFSASNSAKPDEDELEALNQLIEAIELTDLNYIEKMGTQAAVTSEQSLVSAYKTFREAHTVGDQYALLHREEADINTVISVEVLPVVDQDRKLKGIVSSIALQSKIAEQVAKATK